MPRRIEQTTLNASTIDILNVIRANASLQYQSAVPTIDTVNDIPKVGEIIYGTPAFANEFINALVNRIAVVRVQSATFNNPYSVLKKGYLEFGETVEDIFVDIAKVQTYSAEKADSREHKRTLPNLKSAFHAVNWRALYPITIQNEELKHAFLSADGVTNLIAKIVDSVYTAAEYDEFLLFKYMLIKAISHGKLKPYSIGSGSDLKDSAKAFRGISNIMPFMSSEYNEANVKTTTPKDRQVIFMDAMFNADFDVDVLASAFNMEKADFMGRLFLIDNWTSFDNDRFAVIRAESDGIDEVTADELALLDDVKAVLLDENWFQVYDDLKQMKETPVASGLYWNYFYHDWKIISNSPFANAVVFVTSSATITDPDSITIEIVGKTDSAVGTVLTFVVDDDNETLQPTSATFIQTEELTEDGIAVQPYGALIIPTSEASTEIILEVKVGNTIYVLDEDDAIVATAVDVGDTFTLAPPEAEEGGGDEDDDEDDDEDGDVTQ